MAQLTKKEGKGEEYVETSVELVKFPFLMEWVYECSVYYYALNVDM